MTKTEFLEHLEKRLQILNRKERDDILSEYAQHIEFKMENGLCEEAAIEDFGDLEELEAEILDAYNVNPEYGRKSFHFDRIKMKDKVEKTGERVGRLWKRGAGLNRRIKIFWKLCLVAGALFLLYLPLAGADFWIAEGLYGLFGSPLDRLTAWGIILVFHLVYLAFSVFVLYIFACENRQNQAAKGDGKVPKMTESVKAQPKEFGLAVLFRDVLSHLRFWKAGRKRNTKTTGSLLSSIWSTIKVCTALLIKGAVICIIIPVLLLLFAQVIVFGMILVLLVQGYPVIGLSIVSFGGLLCSFAFIWFVRDIMSGEKAGEGK